MPLIDSALANAWKAIDDAALAAALAGNPWTSQHYYDQVSAVIDAQTKTMTIVTSTPGAQVGSTTLPGTGTPS